MNSTLMAAALSWAVVAAAAYLTISQAIITATTTQGLVLPSWLSIAQTSVDISMILIRHRCGLVVVDKVMMLPTWYLRQEMSATMSRISLPCLHHLFLQRSRAREGK